MASTSHKVLERKAVRPIEVEFSLPAEVTLISGKQKQEIEHLEGRSNKLFNWFTSGFSVAHLEDVQNHSITLCASWRVAEKGERTVE